MLRGEGGKQHSIVTPLDFLSLCEARCEIIEKLFSLVLLIGNWTGGSGLGGVGEISNWRNAIFGGRLWGFWVAWQPKKLGYRLRCSDKEVLRGRSFLWSMELVLVQRGAMRYKAPLIIWVISVNSNVLISRESRL